MLRVLTSNRAVSLQNVALDITKVASSMGIKAMMVPRIVQAIELKKAGDQAISVMAVDPIATATWILLHRDCKKLGVSCIYYGTTEGTLDRHFISEWMFDADFVAVSEYVKQKLIEVGFNVIDVIHHGIDMGLISQALSLKEVGRSYLAKALGSTEGKIVSVTVANSHPRKGLAFLDRIAKYVAEKDPNIKFLVITEDRGRSYFSDNSNLVVVTDFGALQRVKILSVLAAADIVTIPSLSEGFGLPVLEAMALGTPVIHGSLPPIMEFSTGFAVPIKEILYFDKGITGHSGIIYEQYLYDTHEFGDVIIQVADMIRNKKESLEDWRKKSREKAESMEISKLYPKLINIAMKGGQSG